MEATIERVTFSAPLAAANHASLYARRIYTGRSPCADYRQGPPLTWMISGLPAAEMNPVFVERIDASEIDRTIDSALRYFGQKNVGATEWWARPGVDPEELGRRLEAHGMAFCEGSIGMALDLQAMPDGVPPARDLTIEPVTTDDALRRFVHALLEGLEAPADFEGQTYEFYRGVGFDLPLRSYLGSLDGEPVATSQLFLDGLVAGVYAVATAPWARRRGIGTSMTMAAMCDARTLGYRTAVLQASPIGFPVYRRLGFQEVCRMTHWEWCGTSERSF